MSKKTIVFSMSARPPDIFSRLGWAVPALLLPVGLFRYFTLGKHFQEFLLISVVSFLIPALNIFLLNSRARSLGKLHHLEIDSQGILYYTSGTITVELELRKYSRLNVQGRARERCFLLKSRATPDEQCLEWPWEFSREEKLSLQMSLKVFGVDLHE